MTIMNYLRTEHMMSAFMLHTALSDTIEPISYSNYGLWFCGQIEFYVIPSLTHTHHALQFVTQVPQEWHEGMIF